MNTNPKAHRILCYGDSLTRGRVPASTERWAVNERWTGVMQATLWNDFEIVEEGVRSRTSQYEIEDLPGRNGLSYFYPCILSHLPLDILIIFLGTNDILHKHSIEDTLVAFDKYKNLLSDACKSYEMHLPKVILISPPWIERWVDDNIIVQLWVLYKEYATKQWWEYVNAKDIIGNWVIDGVHLSKEQNLKLWEYLGKYIKWLF